MFPQKFTSLAKLYIQTSHEESYGCYLLKSRKTIVFHKRKNYLPQNAKNLKLPQKFRAARYSIFYEDLQLAFITH